jgi:hypothetical protein
MYRLKEHAVLQMQSKEHEISHQNGGSYVITFLANVESSIHNVE